MDESVFGGNASAEGGAEEAADVSTTGCNIVLANRLQQTTFTKKAFQGFIKVPHNIPINSYKINAGACMSKDAVFKRGCVHVCHTHW